MIKFFRQIRFKLMETGKTSKYLKYAIGEILLVVIGILLALSLNNWNESRKNELIKNRLIEDLVLELRSSKEKIDEVIITGNLHILNGNLFMKHIGSNVIEVPMDSLTKLGSFFTEGIPFDLNIPIYEEAKSSGRLSMIGNKQILVAYADIMSASVGESIHRTISTEMWYNGSGWELRKEIGNSAIFDSSHEMLPQKFRISEKEFFDILSRLSTFATLKNALQMKENRLKYMNRISKGMAKVIELLENE